MYDPAGNLMAHQRRRETGTLIDNLTYAYPIGSNRLSSVTDAVVGSAETWDAESGSFTWDANGNLLTAPAPYTITAVSYDHRNLPLSLARSGRTTTYRYDDAGQRIAKQVGAGNAEVYVLEGVASLGMVRLGGRSRVPDKDLDEYPPAVIRPDDPDNVSVAPVNRSQNRRSGARLRREIETLPDGTRVTITPPHDR